MVHLGSFQKGFFSCKNPLLQKRFKRFCNSPVKALER